MAVTGDLGLGKVALRMNIAANLLRHSLRFWWLDYLPLERLLLMALLLIVLFAVSLFVVSSLFAVNNWSIVEAVRGC